VVDRPGLISIVRFTLTVTLCLIPLVGGRPVDRVQARGLAPGTTRLTFPPPSITASAAAVLDADTGNWLYLANADQPLPMASTTKIMTAVVAIEHGHLSDVVRVSKAAATVGGSSMGLADGERLTVRELLYGLLLPSGNDAGVAIAEHISGSMTAFAGLMNRKAADLHLTHTHYLNSYGAFDTETGDAAAHHTTARDLVLLARYAMRHPLFRRIVTLKHYVIPRTPQHHGHVLDSVNRVLYWYPGIDGVKSGWTSGAGICQVVDAYRNGRHLILAILHTANQHTDVRDLLDFGFHDFNWVRSNEAEDPIDQVVITGTRAAPVYFYPYTGHSSSGAFLSYFLRHGGVAVLGFPLTEPINLDGDLEQFFTNQVLSFSPRSNVVTPQRLGVTNLPNPSWLTRVLPVPNNDWRTYYPQTGHSITYRFRSFYLAEGGPATFGYPISEKRFQGADLVQYFENTEFIWHPTSSTTGYIAVAPLGVRRLNQLGLFPSNSTPPF
jgi:D-alanyl-D-alanine carboxypeptidase